MVLPAVSRFGSLPQAGIKARRSAHRNLFGEFVGGVIGGLIAVGGCFLSGVETAGIGCVAATAVRAGVGTDPGGLASGDSAGEAAEAGFLGFASVATIGSATFLLGMCQ